MHCSNRKTNSLLASWALVLSWFVATPGLMPLMFAALAWVDGEHGVELQSTANAVRVVLTHGAQNAGKVHEQIHHHRPMGGALTCFAHSTPGQADHVMSFAAEKVPAIERKAAIEFDASMEVAVPAPRMDFVLFVIPPLPREHSSQAADSESLPRIPAQQHALLI